ncbi:hypothetical protein BJX70DRAFT_401458 [Aspergillus crustosus]
MPPRSPRAIPTGFQGASLDFIIIGGGTSGLVVANYLGMVVCPSRVGMDAYEALGTPGWGWDSFAPYI